MCAELIDERDSSWEVDNARYRIYLFDSPGYAVTTIDIWVPASRRLSTLP